MENNRNYKILISQHPSAHPYLQQLYSKITKKGIKVYAPESIFDLIKKSIKANVIHLHWIKYFIRTNRTTNVMPSLLKAAIFISGLLFLKLLGKKVVITLHNIKLHENIHPQLEYTAFWSCLHIANAVIVHSEYTRKEVIAFYSISGEKVTVIPHGNFVSYYPNVIDREKARRILKIPQSKFVILYLGMIRPYKGLDNLITVLNDILTTERNIIAVICGQAQDKNLQADLLQFSAKFSGSCIAKLEYIHDDEVQVFMNAADVGILPYRYITTSGALLLFMSFQKPVIVPDLEPIREMLGEDGIYFKAGNTKSLEEALHNSQSMNLSDVSRRIYAKALKFSWDNIAEETVAVYRNVTR